MIAKKMLEADLEPNSTLKVDEAEGDLIVTVIKPEAKPAE